MGLTICNSMDCSPPSSSVHGIFQAKILEWVTISFSRGSSQPRDQPCVSYISCIEKQSLYHSATPGGAYKNGTTGFLIAALNIYTRNKRMSEDERKRIRGKDIIEVYHEPSMVLESGDG